MPTPSKKVLAIGASCIGGAFILVVLLAPTLSAVRADARTQVAQAFVSTKELLPPYTPPLLQETLSALTLSAQSYLSVYVAPTGEETVLTEKNRDTPLPIASLTKLMVAVIASERLASSEKISVSSSALRVRGLSGIYTRGDQIALSDALHALLVASHNEVAHAVAERIGLVEFRDAMNQKARQLGLANTTFVNVTGLDPARESAVINYSTVADIYTLARYIDTNHFDLFSCSALQSFDLFDSDGVFITTLKNTDKLLGQTTLPFQILGGKTGETPRAKQNLFLVTNAPRGGRIFSVVLGSQNSFDDMKKLLWYDHDAYVWTSAVARGAERTTQVGEG